MLTSFSLQLSSAENNKNQKLEGREDERGKKRVRMVLEDWRVRERDWASCTFCLSESVFCKMVLFFFSVLLHVPSASGVHLYPDSSVCPSQRLIWAGLDYPSPGCVMRSSTENLTTARQLDEAPHWELGSWIGGGFSTARHSTRHDLQPCFSTKECFWHWGHEDAHFKNNLVPFFVVVAISWRENCGCIQWSQKVKEVCVLGAKTSQRLHTLV